MLAELEQVSFAEVRARPGAIAPEVSRGTARALYVFEGDLSVEVDDGEHRLGRDVWAFVPAGVVHTVAATGEGARYLDIGVAGSGRDGAVTVVRAEGVSGVASTEPPGSGGAGFAGAGAGTGESITNRPNRRATLLVDAEELTVTEFSYGAGERGAKLHVHREHADGFLVVEGEFAFHNRKGTLTAPAGTLVLFPPNVVHGFDNDSGALARCFNFHMPASGFADYLRGRNPEFDQHGPPPDGGVDPSAIVAARLSG